MSYIFSGFTYVVPVPSAVSMPGGQRGSEVLDGVALEVLHPAALPVAALRGQARDEPRPAEVDLDILAAGGLDLAFGTPAAAQVVFVEPRNRFTYVPIYIYKF